MKEDKKTWAVGDKALTQVEIIELYVNHDTDFPYRVQGPRGAKMWVRLLSPLPVEALSVEPPPGFEIVDGWNFNDVESDWLRRMPYGWDGPTLDCDWLSGFEAAGGIMARPIKPEVEKPVEIKEGDVWDAGSHAGKVTIKEVKDGRVYYRHHYPSNTESDATVDWFLQFYKLVSRAAFTPIPKDSSEPEEVGEGWVEQFVGEKRAEGKLCRMPLPVPPESPKEEVREGSRWYRGGERNCTLRILSADRLQDKVVVEYEDDQRTQNTVSYKWFTEVFTPIEESPKIEVGSRWEALTTDAEATVKWFTSTEVEFEWKSGARAKWRRADFLDVFTPIPSDTEAPDGVGEGWLELGPEDKPSHDIGDEVTSAYIGDEWIRTGSPGSYTVAQIRVRENDPTMRYRRPISKPSVVSEPGYADKLLVLMTKFILDVKALQADGIASNEKQEKGQ